MTTTTTPAPATDAAPTTPLDLALAMVSDRAKAVAEQDNRAAMELVRDQLLTEDINWLVDRVRTLTAHSNLLNQIGFRVADALGDVPEGETTIVAHPGRLVDRLIAEYKKARATAQQADGTATASVEATAGDVPVGEAAIATVRGSYNVRVIRTVDSDGFSWISATEVDGEYWHAAGQVTDIYPDRPVVTQAGTSGADT